MSILIPSSAVTVSPLWLVLPALAVLAIYWEDWTPSTRRMVVASGLALLLASTSVWAFPIPDPCLQWEPWSPMWILLGYFW